MKPWFTWLYLSCKRHLKRPVFLLLLLLFPTGAFFMDMASRADSGEIRIAVCVQGDQHGEIGSQLLEVLLQREPESGEMFTFYQCADEQEVMEEVASRRAECGYVVLENLEQKLEDGEYKRNIQVYSAPSTVTAAISAEVVFSKLAELYNRKLLTTYVESDLLFEPLGSAGSIVRRELSKEAAVLYDKWLSGGSTFRFEYQTISGISLDTNDKKAATENFFPVRGLAAVYVFVTGLFAAACLRRDERDGLFLPLSYQMRRPCQIVSLAAPVLLAAGSGVLALAAGGIWEDGWREILIMLAYTGAVVLFSWLLSRLISNPDILVCLIPFFAIGSLIFCPVFLDISRYLDVADAVGRWFLPYYYLMFF